MEDDGTVLVGQEFESQEPILDFGRSQRDQVAVVEQLGRDVDDVAVRPETKGMLGYTLKLKIRVNIGVH